MNKKMSPNFNDSYISAVTASTENHEQSFISNNLENTNDILLFPLNDFPFNKTFKKSNSNKKQNKKLLNKTFC